MAAVDGVSDVTVRDHTLTVKCDDDAKTAVIDAVERAGSSVEDFDTEDASLEDLFVSYTEGNA